MPDTPARIPLGLAPVVLAVLAVAGAAAATAVPTVAATSQVRGAAPAPGQDPARLIERLEEELARLGSRRESVVEEFEAADVELALRRQQQLLLTERAAWLEQQGRDLAAEVARLQGSIALSRRALAVRAASLYRIGPLSYNRLLLAADSARSALVAYQLITFMTASDRELVRDTRATLEQLQVASDELARTRRGLEAVQEEAVAAAADLELRQQERQALLRRIDVEAEAKRVALEGAAQSARELDATLGELGEGSEASTAAFGEARGQLLWPAPGEVVGDFGRRRHPVYDTYTLSRGVEIAAQEGDPIVAVFAGRVVFADWYSGYGLLVILDHGDGYFTLYGHLSEIAVRTNDRVLAGQLVGRAGDTASLSGTNLYFEVRERSDALNPMQWLRPRD